MRAGMRRVAADDDPEEARRRSTAPVAPPSSAPCSAGQCGLVACVVLLMFIVLASVSERGMDGPGRRRLAAPAAPDWNAPPGAQMVHHHSPKAGQQNTRNTGAAGGATLGAAASGRAASAAAAAETQTAAALDDADAERQRALTRELYPEFTGKLPYRLGTRDEIDKSTLVLLVVSNQPYQWWQLRLAHYHLQRVKQPGKIYTLMTTEKPDEFKMPHSCDEPYSGCPFFITKDYTNWDGDSFVVYNRAFAIRDFLVDLEAKQKAGLEREYTNVVIIEPDMFMLKPLQIVAEPHKPVGFHYFYMEESYFWGNNTALLQMCTTHPKLARAIGVPYILTMDDLKTLLPLWIPKTKTMRLEQPWLPKEGKPRSWIADMWGFACAVSDLGWGDAIDDPELAPEPPIDQKLFPRSVAIHYTYGNIINENQPTMWKFDKREWYDMAPRPRPYTPLPQEASPLQRDWQSLMNEALLAVYGPAGPRGT